MIATIASLCLLLWADEPIARKEPATKEELAQITERGRLIAGYDNAAWHGSDAFVALKPEEGTVERYIARKTEIGWVVSFGKLNRARDRYLVAYEATQGDAPDQFKARKIAPPRPESGFALQAAKAIDLAQADFVKKPPARRTYNVIALPAEVGKVWVYFVPAPIKAGVWPIGGDVRYLVSPADFKIDQKRPLHRSIIETQAPKGEGDQKLVLGMHTHILDDIPEDTDVSYVLTRKPSVGEMIVSKRFCYAIEADGSIKYVGKSEDLNKK